MAKPATITGIDCDGDATEGMRRVLRFRFSEMCELRNAALDWTDPRGVHDMRVASRRLRSALTDFMPYLRKRFFSAPIKELRSLADALGGVRDQDVAIAALEKMADKRPADVATTLSQVVAEHQAIRNRARKEVKRKLRRDQLRQMESAFGAALDAATIGPRSKRPTKGVHPPAKMSYRKIARLIILERLEEMEKLSPDLYRPFEVEPLHQLRIAVKRLRYALELFGPCWGDMFATFSRKAAEVQSALGDLHDCDVWIDGCGKRLSYAKAQEDKQADPHAWLLGYFITLRTKNYRKALKFWREWERNDLNGLLKTVIQSDIPERVEK